jgi:acylglycerol lipase
VLFIHGEEDRESNVEDTRRAYELVASRDKKLEVIPHGYHEIFLDVEKEVYKRKIVDWLKVLQLKTNLP